METSGEACIWRSPRPHESSGELIPVLIVKVDTLFVTIKTRRKFLGLSKSKEETMNFPSVSKSMDTKIYLETKLHDQDVQTNELTLKIDKLTFRDNSAKQCQTDFLFYDRIRRFSSFLKSV